LKTARNDGIFTPLSYQGSLIFPGFRGGGEWSGATADEKFRAIDKKTGEILWEYKLPYGGYATPATYEVDHVQYVVIAAGGGGKVGTKSGDVYIAFKLKSRK
jgi:quinoprotein glucose dehydrogenase